jgi:hypothetical protein
MGSKSQHDLAGAKLASISQRAGTSGEALPRVGAGGEAAPRHRAGGWRNISIQTRGSLDFAWMIPFGIAVVYLLVFVVKFPYNARELGWISDYASGFTVPETVAKSGTGGQTVLASSGQWVSLWFGLLTARLPLHRQLWTIAPTALFIFTALTIGWSVAQLASRRAAALAALIVLVVSPVALFIFMAAVNHNSLYPCTALTGAYLIWLTRGQGRARAVTVGVPVLAGLVLGVCLASDLLVAATAGIPLFLVALLAGLRRSPLARTVALSAAASAVIAVPVAKLTSTIMRSSGFVTLPTPFEIAKLSELATQARLLFTGLKSLFTGDLERVSSGALYSGLGVVCEIFMVLAFLALLVVGVRVTVRLLRSGWRKDGSETKDHLAVSLHIVFWVGSAMGACLAAWLTAEMSTANVHQSYYASVILSVAAVVPLLISTRLVVRWLVIAGVSIFFAAGLLGLAGSSHYFNGLPAAARYESTIEAIAKRYRASTGYAGYWEASSVTWSTGNRVVVRPLMLCRNPTGADICPFYMERVPSWYLLKQRKTFLLVDSAEPWLDEPPEGLGRPVAVYGFGTIRMYIYPYDIASRLGPPLNPALF